MLEFIVWNIGAWMAFLVVEQWMLLLELRSDD